MAVETVEILPLGAPHLGMTRAEMLEYAASNVDQAISLGDTFYTLLFAYVIAMFIAGRLLTRTQYVIANIMYVAVMTMTVFGFYSAYTTQNHWGANAGLNNTIGSEIVMGTCALFAILVILSIWFGRKVRHPTSELPQ
ncbi:MAG: hypothetical protein ABJ056_05745 [Halioglobus sp.]